jgi:lysophospholipase L1-like esterase
MSSIGSASLGWSSGPIGVWAEELYSSWPHGTTVGPVQACLSEEFHGVWRATHHSQGVFVMAQREWRICFVGDSFVNGTGDPEYLGWTGRVCMAARRRGPAVTAYNLGVRRDTSVDLSRRWQQGVAARVSIGGQQGLVFSFGTNDCTREQGTVRVPLSQTLGHARTVLCEARLSAPVLMVGPPPPADHAQNEDLQQLGSALASLCGEIGILYLDMWTPLLVSGVWMKEAAGGDGAHPGAVGYAEWARVVDGWPACRAWFGESGQSQGMRSTDTLHVHGGGS